MILLEDSLAYVLPHRQFCQELFTQHDFMRLFFTHILEQVLLVNSDIAIRDELPFLVEGG